MKINKALSKYRNRMIEYGQSTVFDNPVGYPIEWDTEVKQAIYKAGLEAIGEEEKPHTKSRTSARHARNKLREKQAEAWAQLCGIEGESDDN